MSHEFESGALVGKQAWHGLANLLPDAPTSIYEMRLAAGMDWGILPGKVFAVAQRPGENEPTPVEVKEKIILLRDTDLQPIGIAGADYPILQLNLFDRFQPLVDKGLMLPESFGVLRKGNIVYAQFRYGKLVEVAPGDTVEPFLSIATTNGQDLSNGFRSSIRVFDTKTRTVCWNTLSGSGFLAYQSVDNPDFESPDGWSIPHLGSVEAIDAKLDEIVKEIVQLREQFEVSIKFFRKLSVLPMTEGKLREVARMVFQGEERKIEAQLNKLRRHQEMSGEVSVATAQLIQELEKQLAEPTYAEAKVVTAYREAPGHELAGETLWGGLNAITYQIDHGKRGSVNARQASSWLGEGKLQRNKALAIFAELAGGA